MIEKRIQVPDLVRRLPTNEGRGSIVRFQREYASKLSGDAVFQYFPLTAVSNKNGLSFYSDNALALRLRTTERMIAQMHNSRQFIIASTTEQPRVRLEAGNFDHGS